MRAVIRRLSQLEQRLAPRAIPPVSVRIHLIHSEDGLTGILVLESDGSTTHIVPTEEEREEYRTRREAAIAARYQPPA